MLRSMLIVGLISVAGASAAATETQEKLAVFMAKADGRVVEKLDHRLAVCLTDHATGFQVNRLLSKAKANDKEGFQKLFKRFSSRRAKLQDCAERAVLRAMFGG